MRAIVIRHYKTLINAKNCIMGWGDSPRVNQWESDLRSVNNIFKKQGIRFDAVYSSSLERARQTALYYAHKNGRKRVKPAKALNEVNYGKLFRKSKKWVRANVPEYKTDPEFVFPEGESFSQMQRRSVKFLRALDKRHPSDTILIVVHAGVIRGFICEFLGLDYASNLKRKISHRYIGDFQLRNGKCIRYNELGKLSGFVTEAGVKLKRAKKT